jgi:hypothetical protein
VDTHEQSVAAQAGYKLEIGESIAVSVFVSADEEHSEQTCPWHEKASGSADAMPAQDGDEDAAGSMPDNSGKKLGNALKAADTSPPEEDTVEVYYVQGQIMKYPGGGKSRVVRIYDTSAEVEQYKLQYAPHHLVPGNESLKGSAVVAFLGADSVIGNFKQDGNPSSVIKDGMSAGYDVNIAANGEWLPSPYALSMSNQWPSAEGIKAILRRKGGEIASKTEEFKLAYAFDAINRSGKQFHMRHADYSAKVREILDQMGAKIKLLARVCPITKKDESGGKFDPPGGLAARLNALSARMRAFVTGYPGLWRAPLFTDESALKYTEQFIGPQQQLPDNKVM